MTELISGGIRHLKRVIISLVGFTVLALGIAMIVLPGPAIVVIPLGLGILATEFIWARSLLKRAKNIIKRKERSIGNVESMQREEP